MSPSLADCKTINRESFPFSKYDALFLIGLNDINRELPKKGFGKNYPNYDTLQSELDSFEKNLQWFCNEYKRKHHKGIVVGQNCDETLFQEMLDRSWCTRMDQLPKPLKKELDEKNVKTGLVVGMHAFRCVDAFCDANPDKFCLTVISNLTFPWDGRTYEEEEQEFEKPEDNQPKEEPHESEQIGLKVKESNNNPRFNFGSNFPIAYPRRLCIDSLPNSTPILDTIIQCPQRGDGARERRTEDKKPK